MKTRGKIITVLLVMAVLGAGLIVTQGGEGDGSGKDSSRVDSSRSEKEIVTLVAKELKKQDVILTDYYFTTRKEIQEALGIGVEEEKLILAIIKPLQYESPTGRASAVLNTVEAVFKHDQRVGGVVVLAPQDRGEPRLVHASRKDFQERKEEGLEGIKLYNSLETFRVDKKLFNSSLD